MRRLKWIVWLSTVSAAIVVTRAAEQSGDGALIPKPNAFSTIIHPNCSHCNVEANRRKDELRADDRVLCWMQVLADGYINDGVIPLRFFLASHRVLDDGWGTFVYDPDAGFARGFAPDAGPFRFHGWHNGIMVIRSEKDGSLYSGLSGMALEGPAKGTRLQPRPTIVTDWGFWQKRYPHSVAYFMYERYKPTELPAAIDEDSRRSRARPDERLPADTPVLAVAYRQPWGTSGLSGDAGWVFHPDAQAPEAPFVDARLGAHWDITGRPVEGGPRLVWLDSVQVKWFAWAGEYPDTSIYGELKR
jgi:hypothetical protein